ncbi:MAG: multidrug transporter [Treponema sp.]|jgi:hypothetical protein|nr:multidrug transporter [Treponema sp.]
MEYTATMDIFLQVWGGVAYLLAKIFLSQAEGLQEDRTWRLMGWAVYLIGLPAWVIVLASKQNWIASAIEAGGAPALVLGLVTAWKRLDQIPRWLDWFVKGITYLMIVFGIAYSMYYFKGITTLSQMLEIGVTFGFLLGTYLLAKKNPAGWLLFAQMLICMALLMYLQDNMMLCVQQILSLVFVINGFIRAFRKQKSPRIEKASPV